MTSLLSAKSFGALCLHPSPGGNSMLKAHNADGNRVDRCDDKTKHNQVQNHNTNDNDNGNDRSKNKHNKNSRALTDIVTAVMTMMISTITARNLEGYLANRHSNDGNDCQGNSYHSEKIRNDA